MHHDTLDDSDYPFLRRLAPAAQYEDHHPNYEQPSEFYAQFHRYQCLALHRFSGAKQNRYEPESTQKNAY